MSKERLKKQLVHLKTRHLLILCAESLLFSLLFFAGFCLLITGAAFFELLVTDPWTLILPAGITAIFCGCGTSYYIKKSLLEELIRADHVLGSKDLLSTACEYSLKETSGSYGDALIREALAYIQKKTVQKIFPFGRSHLANPCVAYPALLFCLISFGLTLSAQRTVYTDHSTPSPGTLEMESFLDQIEKKISGLTEHSSKRNTAAAKEKTVRWIRDIRKQVKQAELTKAEFLHSLSGLFDGIQSDIARDLETIKENFDFSNLPTKNFPPSSTGSAGQKIKRTVSLDLDDLRKKIQEAFENKLPEDLSDELDDMENRLEFQSYLGDMIQHFDDRSKRLKRFDPGDNKGPAKNRTVDGDDPSDPLENHRQTLQERRERGYAAGSQKGPADIQNPAGDIKTSDAAAVKDVSKDPVQAKFRITIKALSSIGVSEKSEESIQKEYQKRNETVLLRETIPIEYKEVIRDYFLSIGLEGD